MGYTKNTITGVWWTGLLRGSARILALVRTAILARLLSPEEFGFFGIAAITLGFLEMLLETGINIFLIQEDEKKISTYIDTAWIVSIVRGTLIALTLLLAAPWVANFFQVPSSLNLLRLIAIVPFIRGLINPAVIYFQKLLKFKPEFWFRISLTLVDAMVAITVVLITRSVAGIIWGLIASAVVEVVLSHIIFPQRPTLSFNFSRLKRIISRGKWITVSSLFNFLSKQGVDGVVGKLIGPAQMGLFQLSQRVASEPASEVTDVFGKVTFPVYVRIAKDAKRVRKAYQRNLATVLALVTPLILVVILFPTFLIKLFLGSQWLKAAPLITPLAIYALVRTVTTTTAPIILAFKKQKFLSIIATTKLAVIAITVIPLTSNLGTLGTIRSLLLSSVVTLPMSLYFVHRLTKSDSK